MTKQNTRYLFVLLGALGDVVRGMSLVDALKAAQPGAHISWLVEPANEGVVRLHSGVDDVIVFERHLGFKGFIKVRNEFKRRHFDITFDLQRHLKSGAFSWLSGASIRVGFHPKDSKEGNWIFNNRFISRHGESISKVEHYRHFLTAIGIEGTESVTFGLDHHRLENIESDWKNDLSRPYVALVLGSSWDSKDWPIEGYAGLLDLLEGRQVVLLGDSSKIEMGKSLLLASKRTQVLDLSGRTSLSELVALIQGAAVCVGPDSGPGHIAGAVGTPHITLFGPTSPVRNTPSGSERLSITANIGCAPCKRRICPGLGKICMRMIRPEAVFERLSPFLDGTIN